MKIAIALLLVLLATALFVHQRSTPVNVIDAAPKELFSRWEAQSGPHLGRALVIRRDWVELRDAKTTISAGALIGIYSVDSEGGYPRYRVEYGTEDRPESVTVMIDQGGSLRLANSPQSEWVANNS